MSDETMPAAPPAPEVAPAVPEAPVTPVTPVAPEAAEAPAEGGPGGAAQAPAKPPRRVLRAVARWTAAVLVCGGLGTGVAYGITGMERGDVPGLATEHDGRWEYPRLTLPALPQGSPRPFTDGNDAEIHHADLRRLLLPAPAGATVDKKLNGGWATVGQYVAEYEKDERPEIEQALTDHAVRHIAARGWTMPDGTSTRVYLLRFNSAAFAQEFQDGTLEFSSPSGLPLTGSPEMEADPGWPEDDLVRGATAYVYEEVKPYGPERTRQAYVVAGDTVALLVQSRKGDAPDVPFHQTVILQSQLLG
ncbi:hypothetical protein [Streptomyces sp. NPDC047928]|uniref:hypothetical protein n=1 Tax=unclassified Streptomyces TaxID=2593676 RepID=UPI0037178E84